MVKIYIRRIITPLLNFYTVEIFIRCLFTANWTQPRKYWKLSTKHVDLLPYALATCTTYHIASLLPNSPILHVNPLIPRRLIRSYFWEKRRHLASIASAKPARESCVKGDRVVSLSHGSSKRRRLKCDTRMYKRIPLEHRTTLCLRNSLSMLVVVDVGCVFRVRFHDCIEYTFFKAILESAVSVLVGSTLHQLLVWVWSHQSTSVSDFFPLYQLIG